MNAIVSDRPSKRLAPDVADELMAARARLAGLEQQLSQATLDDIAKKPGAAAKLAAMERDVAAATATVVRLERTLRFAEGQDANAERDARTRMQNSQLAAFRSHARARHEAMVTLSTALETAAKAYRNFHDRSQKMLAALPIATSLPPGALDKGECYVPGLTAGAELIGDFQPLIALELYRVSHVPGDPLPSLPGSSAPMPLRHIPEKIQSAPDRVLECNTWVVDAISEQINTQARVAT